MLLEATDKGSCLEPCKSDRSRVCQDFKPLRVQIGQEINLFAQALMRLAYEKRVGGVR